MKVEKMSVTKYEITIDLPVTASFSKAVASLKRTDTGPSVNLNFGLLRVTSNPLRV